MSMSRISHRMVQGSSVLLLATAIGCQKDVAGPPTKEVLPVRAALQAGPGRGIEDEFVRTETEVPGFGGFYRDDAGNLVVRVVDLGNAAIAAQAVERYRQRNPSLAVRFGAGTSTVTVIKGNFPFSALVEWKSRLKQFATKGLGIVYYDADEFRNQVRVGLIAQANADEVMALADRLGIPKQAIFVEVLSEQPALAASVRDTRRPTIGGIQIQRDIFGGNVQCSIGYHVVDGSGNRYALTANHCTEDVTGSAVGQAWKQATTTSWGTIAVLPAWSSTGCDAGASYCIYADVTAVSYVSGVSGEPKMAETSTVGMFTAGNTTIGSVLNAAAPYGEVVGDTVFKTGRTSGTTKGRVGETCVDVVFDDGLEVFCLNSATMWGDGGDSGGPVYLKHFAPLSASYRAVRGTVVGVYHPGNFVELPKTYYNPWDRIETVLGLGALDPTVQ